MTHPYALIAKICDEYFTRRNKKRFFFLFPYPYLSITAYSLERTTYVLCPTNKSKSSAVCSISQSLMRHTQKNTNKLTPKETTLQTVCYNKNASQSICLKPSNVYVYQTVLYNIFETLTMVTI